jgi:thioredoxin reductase
MEPQQEAYDVVIIGGGPAGLSAGLWLARYRRRTIVVDAGDPRNAETWAVHGYPGVDEVAPYELRRRLREQAITAGSEIRAAMVNAVEGREDDFRVTLSDGHELRARRVLLCTGLKDILPEIPGFDELYGKSIWHCPDCDGPGVQGKKVGIIGWGTAIAKYALYFLVWTDQLTVLTHSHDRDMSPEALEALAEQGIRVDKRAITRLDGENGKLRCVVYHDGEEEPFDALFFHIATGAGSTLPQDMGCTIDAEGILEVDKDFATTVPGVYAAGDITPGTRLVVRAAYEGTRAAMGIHKSLIPPEEKVQKKPG